MLCAASAYAATTPDGEPLDVYLDLPLSQLLDVKISLAARRPQSVQEAANAVFVISEEDIRRSAATNIPELLRMVPGLHVARISTSSWAVTARGFNGAFSNKLLVLMDGRTVYTPAFSGVYWDVQDTLLEDIDRIEVIRGPGATLWGANAVNGVINIITKSALDTLGGIATLNVGDEQRVNTGIRYGWALDDGAVRAYAKAFRLDAQQARATGASANDDWDALRGGFRLDRQTPGGDQWTVQGDLYDSRPNQVQAVPGLPLVPEEIRNTGWNLTGRWSRPLGDGSSVRVQAYLDQTERVENSLGQKHQTLDLDFQHQTSPLIDHNLVWGLAYRAVQDDFDNSAFVGTVPSRRTTRLYSAFVQDDITVLRDRLRVVAGAKIEHNGYTGNEIQPNLRLAWTPSDRTTVWTGVSRAIRSPSRMERSGYIISAVTPGPVPVPVYAFGDSAFDSEELIAYEAGYRRRIGHVANLDLAVFRHRYKRLAGNDFTGYPQHVRFISEMHARSHGVEIALDWRPSSRWETRLAYSAQSISAERTGSADTTMLPDDVSRDAAEHSTPYQQLSLRSHLDLDGGWRLDAWLRHVGEVRANRAFAIDVPSYTSLDLRLAWQVDSRLELSLVGKNLLDPQHPEFVQEALVAPAEIERSLFARVRLAF
ncbi:MAG: TonB-dependent receptor [Rhodocyclaceae bacterium]|nr:TonB-dependent receptor [Rhodocyclaceae bacterium]